MESTRVAPRLDSSEADPREAIDALVRDLVQGDRDAAERFPIALKAFAVQHPTAQTRDYFQALLESKAVDGHFDASGISCRAAVIQAQLALGFPFALEVSPDDLAWLRDQTALHTQLPNRARFATGGLAVLSMAWSVFVLALVRDQTLLQAPFWLGGIHGLIALVASLFASPTLGLAQRRSYRGLYRLLAWAGWLGPVLSVVAAFIAAGERSRPNLDFAALVGAVSFACALPAMVTALTAGIAGRRLVPEDEDEPPVDR